METNTMTCRPSTTNPLHAWTRGLMPLLVLCTLMLSVLSVGAATLTVSSLADDGTPGTLRSQIAAAASGDTIEFSVTGTIALTAVGDNTLGPSALLITKPISIIGPSGTSSSSGITITRSSSVANLRLFRVSTTGDLTLRNLTLTGGTSIGGFGGDGFGSCGGGGGGAGLGGAIIVGDGGAAGGSLTIENSTLTGHSVTGGRGGGHNGIQDVDNNGFGGSGGGLRGSGTGGSGGSRFNDLASRASRGGFGGGGGGGADNYGSEGGFGGGGGGGGGNAGFGAGDGAVGGANGGGGGGGGLGSAILNYGGTVTLLNSTLAGNSARGGTGVVGGGNGSGLGTVFNGRGSLTINSCTFSGNSADRGGAVFNFGNQNDNVTTLVMNNSILANSNADYSAEALGGTQSSSGTNNLIESGSGAFSGTATLTADPKLGELADNGGPTQTLAPLTGSPAIDAGNSDRSTDQRGGARIFDYPDIANASGGNGSDIGAFETRAPNIISFTPATGPSTSTVVTITGGGTGFLGATSVKFNTTSATDYTVDSATQITVTVPQGASTGKISVTTAGGTAVSAEDFRVSEVPSLVVTTTADSTPGSSTDFDGLNSLREAFTYANNLNGPTAPSITFSVGGTITLTSGELVIARDLTIAGPQNAPGIKVSGNNASRIFSLTSGTVNLSHLTLSGGNGVGSIESGSGGAINNNGNLTVTSCTLSGNSATQGGAIHSNTGTLTVSNSTFSSNSASNGGGGIFVLGGTLNLSHSTFSGNNSTEGGAIRSSAGALTVSNSTFSGSSATSNGGAILSDGTLTISSSTFSGNSAANGGGSISVAGGTLHLSNSIVAGNSASSGPDILGPVASGSYNLIGQNDGSTGLANNTGGNKVGTTASPLDAQLTVLADNGGPTQTMRPGTGSPTIDAGNSPLSTDQRGFSRIVDDPSVANASGGNGSDIGAYELIADPPSNVVTTTQDVVDYDGQNSLREAIAWANSNGDASTVSFAPALAGSTITLSAVGDGTLGPSALLITTPVTIIGLAGTSSSSGITITRSSVANLRLFRVSTTGDLTLRNLTLTGGTSIGGNGGTGSGSCGGGGGGAGLGGAIMVGDGGAAGGSLTIENSTLTGHSVTGGRGGGHNGIQDVDNNGFGGSGGGLRGNGTGGTGGSRFNDLAIRGSRAPFGGGGGGGADGYGSFGGFGGGGGGGGGGAGFGGGFGAQGFGVGGGGGGGLGSAILNYGGTVTLLNSTLADNSARGGANGGGGGNGSGLGTVFNGRGSLTINSCTFSGNSADRGGAVFNFGNQNDNVTTLVMNNSILANSNADYSAEALGGTQSSSGTNNLIESGSGAFGGTATLTADPKLGALADNGGPTQTFALGTDSPAINAGDPAFDGTNTPYDQRGPGYARKGGSAIDIGAFERIAITGFTPTSGPIGTTVTITGSGFPGTTAVTFNGGSGTAAANPVVNAAGTQITVNVPAGATTGTISVTTPSGAATSTTEFTVVSSSIVTTISDDINHADGLVSLREAIVYTNTHDGADTITFSLPEIDKGDDNKWTIAPTSALPTIGEAVTIDGVGTVILSGSSAGTDVSGLTVASSGSTIKSLHFSGWSGNGIRVESGNGNSLRGNTFSDNTGTSINLVGGEEDSNSVNTNDAGDTDSGANNLQNSPSLAKARTPQGAAGTTVEGTLLGQPGAIYTIDLYSNITAHASGYGEGATPIGTTTVSRISASKVYFSVILPVQPLGSIITAIATDASGNSSEFSNDTVNSNDVTGPTVTVTTPASGSSIEGLDSIMGNASDSGSGVVRVETFLRYKDGSGVLQYWARRGAGWNWGSDVLSIPATLANPGANSTGWSISNGSPSGTVLPSGADLPARTYFLLAYAYDAAGNKARSLTPDTMFEVTAPAAPAVTVTSPVRGSKVQSLASISGTAVAGIGVAQVQTFLRYKNSSGIFLYWAKRSGTWGWGSAILGIPATLTNPGAASTDWTVSNGSPSGTVLPSGANLPARTYYVLAYVYDSAGVRTRSLAPDTTFKVEAPVSSGLTQSEGQKSTVVLSSASITAGGVVTLTFTGALNASKAVEASRYSVQQNGVELEVSSAAYNATNRSVTLTLEEAPATGSLEVSYTIADSKGLAVIGQTSVTMK